MLDENDVVDAVCKYLKDNGFEFNQILNTSQQGIDIIAVNHNSNERYLIEAKGATSSKKGTPRFGKPFSDKQVYTRASKAFYTALRLREENKGDETIRVGVAFPDVRFYRKYTERIEETLRILEIEVFWVKEDGKVT